MWLPARPEASGRRAGDHKGRPYNAILSHLLAPASRRADLSQRAFRIASGEARRADRVWPTARAVGSRAIPPRHLALEGRQNDPLLVCRPCRGWAG